MSILHILLLLGLLWLLLSEPIRNYLVYREVKGYSKLLKFTKLLKDIVDNACVIGIQFLGLVIVVILFIHLVNNI